MKHNSLIFIGWSAYGDQLSYNGMIRFLLTYFERVFLSCDSHLHGYVSTLYNDIIDKIILIDDRSVDMVVSQNPDIFILNSKVDFQMELGIPKIWGSSSDFSNLVDKNKFICDKNKIANIINIEEKFTENNFEYVDNSSNFYVHVGLNPLIKTKNFYYQRNIEIENDVYNDLLTRNNISHNEEYIVICEFSPHLIKEEYKENKKIINIERSTPNPLHLGKVLENASEIHLIETSNSLFLYYCCLSNVLNVKNVNIHVYSRDRYEYYWRMIMNPIIKDWNFIF